MAILNVNIPDEKYKNLKFKLLKQDKTISDWVREQIDSYLVVGKSFPSFEGSINITPNLRVGKEVHKEVSPIPESEILTCQCGSTEDVKTVRTPDGTFPLCKPHRLSAFQKYGKGAEIL